MNPMSLNPILPLEPIQKWGLIFLGPFKPATNSMGNKYVIILMDYCTKWVEAWALWDNKVTFVAKFLL